MKKSLFFLICLLGILPLCAHIKPANNFYFRHYTNKNGLSHNTVYCSLQDQRGFLWFGTENGLNRFDGHSFTTFTSQSELAPEKRLPGDHIIHLYEDSTGKIWICTSKGTCYYDYNTGEFVPFILEGNSRPVYFNQVKEDKKQNLWFRENNKIIKYNLNTKAYQTYDAEEYGFRSVTMTMTEEGIPVFADVLALYEYNPNTDNFIRTPVISDPERDILMYIQFIQEVPQAGTMVGTDKGLKMYYTESNRIETIIPDIYVRSIMPYTNTLYYIASESGIYIYNLLDQTYTNIRKSLTNEYSLGDNATYSLTKDREGGIWIGSFFGGVNYLPAIYTPFRYYIGGKTHSGMLGNTVREICPDQYGNLWLGTEDNGINRFSRKDNSMINYSVHNTDHKLSASNIHGLYADGDTLWVGTFNKGIDLLDIPSGKIIGRYTKASTQNGLISDFILCFHKTKSGDMLIGTSGGVNKYDKKEQRFSHWIARDNMVRQIYEDKAGNLWVATLNGLYKHIPATHTRPEETILFQVSEEKPETGPVSNNVTSVFEDSKKQIWITTTNGISRYNEEKNIFEHYSSKNGFPGNITFRIVEDSEHFLWISTANGLVKFNPEDHSIHTYNNTDGLHETQFNYCSSYQADNGTIYMGTIDGMISFNPLEFKVDTFIPPIYITRIKLPQDKADKYGSRVVVDSSEQLKISYDMFPLTLSYIALSYTAPNGIQYAYKLDGVDKEWINSGINKEVTFASLSPGKYTFRVKSTNSSGVWQPNEKRLEIIISPPFWASNYAYAFYFILILYGILFFYRRQKRKLEEEHTHKQSLFEIEKEKELYNAKIQFFTFITHEIRTPLSLIKAPLEVIFQSKEQINPSVLKNLDIIDRNTQRLLNLSNQLLDFQKTADKGFHLSFIKTDIRLWTDSLIQPFLTEFVRENKALDVSYPADNIFAYIDREAYAKIITNLLSNALKYSEKQVNMVVKIASGNVKMLTIEVTNDGIVIPENEREEIFKPFYRAKETSNMPGSGIGLSLARSLTDAHNGTLRYGCTDNGLNRFLFEIPVEQGDFCIEDTDYCIGANPDEIVTSPPAENKPAILIVEDQREMRQFIAGELASEYQILEAENGREAVDILKSNNIILIISDVMMPVMDGFDLCNEVKNNIQFSHIPFILLTALHNVGSRLKGLNNGADAYLEKPFSVEILKAQIANLLNNRKLTYKSYYEKPFVPVSTLAISPMDELFLQKLNNYISENLHKSELTVEMIASEMGMSNSSLYRKVKGVSDLSPVDFIRVARLKKAVQLLQAGEKRINEVAFQVGFSSPAYFSSCFQKQYGSSPSEFIKKIYS